MNKQYKLITEKFSEYSGPESFMIQVQNLVNEGWILEKMNVSRLDICWALFSVETKEPPSLTTKPQVLKG